MTAKRVRALGIAAILLLPNPSVADGLYVRVAVGIDRSETTRFIDRDCASKAPAALYGCGTGPDGAIRGTLGDFGRHAGGSLALGYDNQAMRFEFSVLHRPSASFNGRANFLRSDRRQTVSADLSTLAAFLVAYADLATQGLPTFGPWRPFVGAGVGAARIDMGETRMDFPRTTTIVPRRRRTDVAWMLSAGAAVSILDKVALELAWTYTDYGIVETGQGAGRVVWRDGSRAPLALDVDETRAALSGQGMRASLRYAF